MIQKLISALILVPLAILFVVFAVANRQTVVVSFDPFDCDLPKTRRSPRRLSLR